jgi:hypothetical protein
VETPIWGTFSVRDHCRRGAFVREVLLFDRLAVPYPDPNVPGERERWRQPNERDATETWDPDRLDELLSVLGTDDAPGHHGANLVERVPWSPHVWDQLQSRLGAAGALTGDPFADSRLGLRTSADVPRNVEAIAAYPSEEAWEKEMQPSSQEPEDVNAAEALVRLSRPLLLPREGADELETLRRAVALAVDPEYAAMRTAYHGWFRDVIEPLRPSGVDLDDVRMNRAELEDAVRRLDGLWKQEQAIVGRRDRDDFWSRIEVGCVSLGAAGSIGLAALAALPAVGVGVAIVSFAGWTLNRWRQTRPPRSLGGATMYVEAERRLAWSEPVVSGL